MIVGHSLHAERALHRVIPDPMEPKDPEPNRTPKLRFTKSGTNWRKRAEAQDARSKVQDAQVKDLKIQQDHVASHRLQDQIKGQTQQKSAQKAAVLQSDQQVNLRAQTRLIRDEEEVKFGKEKRRTDLQASRFQDKVEFNKNNEVGAEAKSARTTYARRRKESLSFKVRDENLQKKTRTLQEKKDIDALRRSELMAQEEDKQMRMKAEKYEDRILARQIALNDNHWQDMEVQRKAARKKAADDISRRQSLVAKQMLQDSMAAKQNILEMRVEENPPNPFTDHSRGQMSPNSARVVQKSYKGQLDKQISLRNSLREEERKKANTQTSGPSSARVQHSLW